MPDLGLGVTGSLAASLAGVDVGVLDVEGVGDGGGGGGELMPADSASTRRSARSASRNPCLRTEFGPVAGVRMCRRA